MPEPIAGMRHVGLVVRDLPRMAEFYQQALGLRVAVEARESGQPLDTLLPHPDREGAPDSAGRPDPGGVRVRTVKMAAGFSDGPMLELLSFEAPPWDGAPEARPPFHRPGFTHLAFTVNDLDRVIAAVEQAGGFCLSPPQRSADGRVRLVFARDPEGNLLELVGEEPAREREG